MPVLQKRSYAACSSWLPMKLRTTLMNRSLQRELQLSSVCAQAKDASEFTGCSNSSLTGALLSPLKANCVQHRSLRYVSLIHEALLRKRTSTHSQDRKYVANCESHLSYR